VDGILLVLPRTKRARAFVGSAGALLATIFPVPGRRALELLAAGVDPGGSAVIVLPAEARRHVARDAHDRRRLPGANQSGA
jgi:hypothetical protein